MKIIFLFLYPISTGGAIQQKLCLEALQAISMEDTVHDTLDPEPTESQPLPEVIKVMSEHNLELLA